MHAAFTFGLLLRKAVRSGLRAFKAFLRCLEPLRSKVGGPIKGHAMFCGLGPPGVYLRIKASWIVEVCWGGDVCAA